MTKYDKSSGTSIVNGAHDSGVLSKLLEVFINTYVQCYACRNPETQVGLSLIMFGRPKRCEGPPGNSLLCAVLWVCSDHAAVQVRYACQSLSSNA